MKRLIAGALAWALLLAPALAADKTPLASYPGEPNQPIKATDRASVPALKITGVTGSTQCLHADSSGVVSGAGSDCGSGGSLTNPAALGSANLRSGSGSPSASDPVGSVYLRTDNGWAYQMLPAAVAPARVQEVAAGNTYSVTLPASPTAGNWLIAYCYDVNVPTAASGWTTVTSRTGSGNTLIVYKQASLGESTAQTPCGNASTFWKSVSIIEVSGGALWSDIYDGVSFGDKSGLTAAASRATTAGNSLAIGFSGWTLGCCADTITVRSGDGWTNVVQGTAGNAETATVGSQAVASSGTTLTFSTSAATRTDGSMMNAVLILKPPTTGFFSWQKLSGLATIKDGTGTTIEADPRSLKCGAGTTCTSNAGDVTITASGASVGANPTATASDTAVNGSAPTFMRSDAAPAIQKGSASQFGVVKCDGSTITCASGVISAVGGGSGGGGSTGPGSGAYEKKGTVPVSSSFFWVNQGSSTMTNQTLSLNLFTPNTGGTTNFSGIMLTPPAAPYTLYCRFTDTGIVATNRAGGIALYNATNGRLVFFYILGTQVFFQRWSSVTAFNANITSAITLVAPQQTRWLKFDVGPTTVTASYSPDGDTWIPVGSDTLSAFLTATGSVSGAGFGSSTNNGAATYIINHLSTTAPS